MDIIWKSTDGPTPLSPLPKPQKNGSRREDSLPRTYLSGKGGSKNTPQKTMLNALSLSPLVGEITLSLF